MKITKKGIIALALAVLALLIAAYCLLRFGFSVDVMDRSGWHTGKGQVRYLDYYGRPKLQWQYIDGKLYYFAPDSGNMVTGWKQIGSDRYYFGTDGVRASGWQAWEGKPCYLSADGKMVTGWQQLDGKTYYFSDDGIMTTGWHTVDGKRYSFADTGEMRTGWHTVDGKRYYFTEEGNTLSGEAVLDGVRYQFTSDGTITSGWHEDETGKYYFGEDGRAHSGWLDWEGKRYYFADGGKMATGWLTLEDGRYYLNPDGTMAVGKVQIDGTSSFFTSKGKYVLLTNPWHPVPEDFVPKMVEIEGFRFDSVGRDALQQMLNDCRAAGFACTINNTHRSKATQQAMWDSRIIKYMGEGMTREEAIAFIGESVAKPGHSEHQTGLAVDIMGDQPMYDWLAEHCWDYGFILRYPEGKFASTGIIYEPWHFRYVGTELSLELKALGLCLEEYMTQITPK